MIPNQSYLLALHSVNGLGSVRLQILVSHFGDPKLAWEASSQELVSLSIPKSVIEALMETRKSVDPDEYAKAIESSGIRWVSIYDEDYPKLLKEIYDPPVILYYKGLLVSEERGVAVVGTRKVTGYGRMVTEKIAGELVSQGVTVISGLARGVDSQAHKAAVESQGRTVAVLGSGLNKIFPAENMTLVHRILEKNGAVISEFPPDTLPNAGNFPARNRIISGLSLAVVVTEADMDSGSMITARCALEQGRDVFAVPGPITSQLSMGPINLIKQGARPITSAFELLEELGIKGQSKRQDPEAANIQLSQIEKKILECITNEGKHVDELCRQLHQATPGISAALVRLEILGLVNNLGGGNYIKI